MHANRHVCARTSLRLHQSRFLGQRLVFHRLQASLFYVDLNALTRFIRRLNNRPWKTLGYRTRNEVFNEALVALRVEFTKHDGNYIDGHG